MEHASVCARERTSVTSLSILTRSSSSPAAASSWPSTGGNAALMCSSAARRTLLMRKVRSSGDCSSIFRCAPSITLPLLLLLLLLVDELAFVCCCCWSSMFLYEERLRAGLFISIYLSYFFFGYFVTRIYAMSQNLFSTSMSHYAFRKRKPNMSSVPPGCITPSCLS